MGNEDIKIKSIAIQKYKCFEDVVIDCSREDGSIYQWTVLLGNNNTGKTNFLKAIAYARPVRRGYINQKDENTFYTIAALFHDVPTDLNLDEELSVECQFSFPASSFIRCRHNSSANSANIENQDIRFYGYGVSRYPSQTSLSESACDDCDSLLYPDKQLINIEEWLMQLDYAAKNEKKAAESRLRKIKELLCSKLFPEIFDFKFESTETLQNYVLFQTKDGWFRYFQLGYGYQSMLSWVIDFCKRMFERYPDLDNPLTGNAIVLLDEIDLHLHPKWQREIVSFLSGIFPNTQFVVTTHSPLVIQSMDDVNLYVLYRDGEKLSIERNPNSNFRGWTVEEILRDVMHMESDIHSDYYQKLIEKFNAGLDENNPAKSREAFDELDKILHPGNPVRRLLTLQLSQMDN